MNIPPQLLCDALVGQKQEQRKTYALRGRPDVQSDKRYCTYDNGVLTIGRSEFKRSRNNKVFTRTTLQKG